MPQHIAIQDHYNWLGRIIGVSDWMTISQQQINAFADLAGDQQWIHVDEQRAAKESPYGVTIAHGYLILALTPKLMDQVFMVPDAAMGVNRGFNRLRFITPLKSGCALRLKVELSHVDEQESYADIVYLLSYETQGANKPVCVAELLKRWVKA